MLNILYAITFALIITSAVINTPIFYDISDNSSDIVINYKYSICIKDNPRYDEIKDTITSKKIQTIDGEKNYHGWSLALEENTNKQIKITNNNCNIIIRYMDHKPDDIDENTLGNAKIFPFRSDNPTIGLMRGEIEIYDEPNFNGQLMHSEVLKSVVRHEIGHVLGLEHIPNTFMSKHVNNNYMYIPANIVEKLK